MKIALASDIHLEFGHLVLNNDQQADLLILAGDICTAKTFKKKPKERVLLLDFFKNVSEQFPHVIYISGNHESYDYDIGKTHETLKKELAQFSNIHVLEKETVKIGGVTFVAGTLWTNMNQNDSLTLWHCGRAMNDFKCIKNSDRITHHKNTIYVKDPETGMPLKDNDGNLIVERVDHYDKTSSWSPEDSVEDHQRMLDYISLVTASADNNKYVVISHHAPSEQSIAEWYKNDTLMNGAFHSKLDQFILDRPQIALWCHGHMHDPFDYQIGSTRVVCNPRGYIGYESRANNFELKYLEV